MSADARAGAEAAPLSPTKKPRHAANVASNAASAPAASAIGKDKENPTPKAKKDGKRRRRKSSTGGDDATAASKPHKDEKKPRAFMIKKKYDPLAQIHYKGYVRLRLASLHRSMFMASLHRSMFMAVS